MGVMGAASTAPMKAILPALVLVFCSCNVTRSSHVIVGPTGPAIDPSQVQIYLRAPAKYQEVAILKSDSRNAFASDQSLADSAMLRMKEEAAKLGANGVLLSGLSEQHVGTIGNSFGAASAYPSGYGVNAYGSSFGTATPIYAKVAQGIAIKVAP